MTQEGLQMVERDKRPAPEDLEGYTPRYPPDTDYSACISELSMWLSDHRRDEEQERLEAASKRTAVIGHDNFEQQRKGFDPDDFDLNEVRKKIKSGPLH